MQTKAIAYLQTNVRIDTSALSYETVKFTIV